MEQTPYRLFINGKDMLHVLFQLRLAPIFAKIGAILSKTLGKMLVESAVAPRRNEETVFNRLQRLRRPRRHPFQVIVRVRMETWKLHKFADRYCAADFLVHKFAPSPI